MDIDPEIFNVLGDRLTEYSKGWKCISLYILSGYYGLPKSFPKLALILFGFIMKTKLYRDKAMTKDINEDKRIYNDIQITIEDILREWDNGKYNLDPDADIKTDICNMKKRLKELDDNNVFHFWKYNDLYVFIMERDIRIWGFYNPGCKVVPKMLKKISAIGGDMISCMIKDVRKTYGEVDKSDVEESFGCFVNRIIGKMNPSVATSIPKWDGKQDIHEYLNNLSGAIANMNDNEGFTFVPDILDRFPFSISEKMKKGMSKGVTMKIQPTQKEKEVKSLEKELSPDNPNLVRAKIIRRATTTHSSGSSKPLAYEFSADLDPFADAAQFVRYYHAFLQQCTCGKIRFDSYSSDAHYATQVMDILVEHKRTSNKIFLNAWLRFFYEQNLKGRKALKIKYTSIQVFKDTFEQFNVRFTADAVKSV